MSTDLVKEARGKRKNNVQEKSFINTPVVLQINFPILGYESKGTPWDFAEKAPFYGIWAVYWSPMIWPKQRQSREVLSRSREIG